MKVDEVRHRIHAEHHRNKRQWCVRAIHQQLDELVSSVHWAGKDIPIEALLALDIKNAIARLEGLLEREIANAAE